MPTAATGRRRARRASTVRASAGPGAPGVERLAGDAYGGRHRRQDARPPRASRTATTNPGPASNGAAPGSSAPGHAPPEQRRQRTGDDAHQQDGEQLDQQQADRSGRAPAAEPRDGDLPAPLLGRGASTSQRTNTPAPPSAPSAAARCGGPGASARGPVGDHAEVGSTTCRSSPRSATSRAASRTRSPSAAPRRRRSPRCAPGRPLRASPRQEPGRRRTSPRSSARRRGRRGVGAAGDARDADQRWPCHHAVVARGVGADDLEPHPGLRRRPPTVDGPRRAEAGGRRCRRRPR